MLWFTSTGRKLYGVCFASDKHGHVHGDAHLALRDVWDSDFVFWCASAGEQEDWVQVRTCLVEIACTPETVVVGCIVCRLLAVGCVVSFADQDQLSCARRGCAMRVPLPQRCANMVDAACRHGQILSDCLQKKVDWPSREPRGVMEVRPFAKLLGWHVLHHVVTHLAK